MKVFLISVGVGLGIAALIDAGQYTPNPVAGDALRETFDFYVYAAIAVPIALVVGWLMTRGE